MSAWLKAWQRRMDKVLLHGLSLASQVHRKGFRAPGVLLVSYPRSGSSWVGQVLATSEQLAYLREPITQPYLKKYGGQHAIIDPKVDEHAQQVYTRLSSQAFAGIPSTHYGVVDRKRDFLTLAKGSEQTLLIKEVNPRALPFLCANYQPFVILLMRHPAAVALSFKQKGWLEKSDAQADNELTLHMDEWGKFGYAYGECMHQAWKFLGNYPDKVIVQYEDLANDPQRTFTDLFNAARIALPQNFGEVIRQYCHGKQSLESSYNTQRDSRHTARKWKSQLSGKQLNSLRDGYWLSSLKLYRDAEDWKLAGPESEN